MLEAIGYCLIKCKVCFLFVIGVMDAVIDLECMQGSSNIIILDDLVF